MADPRQPITPLRFDTPIVDPAKGTPTIQFVRIWQQLFGNEEGTNEEAATALAAANAAQATAAAAQTDVDAAELEIDALQLAAVPPGGALNEVLTKDSATDYDMSWQPAAGGGGGGGNAGEMAYTKPLAANFTAVSSAVITDQANSMFVTRAVSGTGIVFYAAQTPPTGDFTVTVRFRPLLRNFRGNSYGSIVVRNTSTGRLTLFGSFLQSSQQLLLQNWTNLTTFSSNVSGPTVDAQEPFMRWRRVRKVGADLFWELSPDGDLWLTFATQTIASWVVTIDEIGIGGNDISVTGDGVAVYSWTVV